MAKLMFTLRHGLEQAEARRLLERERQRLTAMIDGKMSHGDSYWREDRLLFRVRALGQSAEGVLTMAQPGQVSVEASVPFPALMLRGKVEARLRKVLRVA